MVESSKMEEMPTNSESNIMNIATTSDSMKTTGTDGNGVPVLQRLESISYDSNNVDRIIFYNATTMISNLETNLLMLLWTQPLVLEIICDIIGVMQKTVHLYLDYKLLISCLPKGFKAVDLEARAIERRGALLTFLLKHLQISESKEDGWTLGLATLDASGLITRDRRRSVSSGNDDDDITLVAALKEKEKQSNSISINSHRTADLSESPQQPVNNNNNNDGGILEKMVRIKPVNLREYTFEEFSSIFCTIPLNSSEYTKIGVPSLREILKRQSVMFNSNDMYDQGGRSVRRHTYDFLGGLNSSKTGVPANANSNASSLFGPIWLNKEGMEEEEIVPVNSKASTKLPSSGFSMKNPSAAKPDVNYPGGIVSSFLPRIDNASNASNNITTNPAVLLASRKSMKSPPVPLVSETNPTTANTSTASLPQFTAPNDPDKPLRNLLASPTEDKRKGHIYDLLKKNGPSAANSSNSNTTDANENEGTSKINDFENNSIIQSKSNIVLPKILGTANNNGGVDASLGLGNSCADNSTGNISVPNVTINGAKQRRRTLGNPLPYDKTPVAPLPLNQSVKSTKHSSIKGSQPSSELYGQPRRSFEGVSSSFLSSAIQTLAKGVQLNSSMLGGNNGHNPSVNLTSNPPTSARNIPPLEAV
jgi:hypothetical protein